MDSKSRIAIASGFALLIVASATILALPAVAAVCSLGAVVVGVLLRCYRSDGPHAPGLSHVLLLSGGLASLALSIAASAHAAEFLFVYRRRLVESLFFGFGMVIVGYIVVCCVLLMFILMLQVENTDDPR
jgi:hypothetical protein